MPELLDLLKEAFHEDNAPRVRDLLAAHPEIRSKINEPICPFDSPPILWVRSREMLDVLLAAGADINAKSRWWAGGFGILHSVAADLAPYAIERGAVVDVHAAARLGMPDRLAALLEASPESVNAPGGDGQTPLHFARDVDTAQLLLSRGARIDARDIDHESTPAQYMIRDRQEVVRFLIARGCQTDLLMAAALGDLDLVRRHLEADPGRIRMNVSSEFFPMRDSRAGGHIYIWMLGRHKTAHAIAREFGHDPVLAFLWERTPDEMKLALACEFGDARSCRELLERAPNLARGISAAYRPAIVHAAQNNNTAAVRLMLEAGWPAGARGQHGGTALHWAAYHGNEEMTRLILRFHPPLEEEDSDYHSTPLGWAIHGSEHGWNLDGANYVATVEALLAAGARVPERNHGAPAVQELLRRHPQR